MLVRTLLTFQVPLSDTAGLTLMGDLDASANTLDVSGATVVELVLP